MKPEPCSRIAGLLAAIVSLGSLHAGEEVPIFNRKDLSGWTVTQGGQARDTGIYWKVVDGMIIGDNPDKLGSVLWTERNYGDYELSLEFKTLSPDYDSGVFLRGESHQVQIGVSRSLKTDLTACVYAPVDGKGSYPATSDKVAKVHKTGEWNKLRVVVEGNRIRTWLNDEDFVDYEAVKIPANGPIGLQLHADVHQKMHFRNLELKANGED